MSLLQRIAVKPWEHQGVAVEAEAAEARRPAPKTALYIFLAVITSLFGLFSISHQMRMGYPDWRVLDEPSVLWLNTGLLVLASVAMQWAVTAARTRHAQALRTGLGAATALTLAFIGGQYAAWQELLSAGYYASGNPSYAFFYLFTGVHALHLAGGLWFLLRALQIAVRMPDDERLPLRVGLCATYWHYLLGVWLLLFYLLLTS